MKIHYYLHIFKVPPHLNELTNKRKLTVRESDRVDIGCPVTGSPLPNISWLMNGQLLKDGETKQGVTLSSSGKSVSYYR